MFCIDPLRKHNAFWSKHLLGQTLPLDAVFTNIRPRSKVQVDDLPRCCGLESTFPCDTARSDRLVHTKARTRMEQFCGGSTMYEGRIFYYRTGLRQCLDRLLHPVSTDTYPMEVAAGIKEKGWNHYHFHDKLGVSLPLDSIVVVI